MLLRETGKKFILLAFSVCFGSCFADENMNTQEDMKRQLGENDKELARVLLFSYWQNKTCWVDFLCWLSCAFFLSCVPMSSVHGLRRFKGTEKIGDKGLPVPFAVLDLKNLVSVSERGRHSRSETVGMLEKTTDT